MSLKFLYRPLACLYGIAVGLRNLLFDLKLLPVKEFDIPVICVGNLAAGGTGKTPHIEYLIRLLKDKYRIAVLSRGYKRRTCGFRMAGLTDDSRSIGDEPYQIYKKFPDIIVAVDANRCRGVRQLLALPADRRPQIVMLDDGFQHRYIKPSLSILLSDFERPFYKDKLLPAGRLREPVSNAKRADIVIFTKCPANEHFRPCYIEQVRPYWSVFHSFFRYKEFTPVFGNNFTRKGDLGESAMLLVTGIARPAPLIRYLNSITIGLQIMLYSDHHDFALKDFEDILSKFNSINRKSKIIVSTEKDAVRLTESRDIPEELKDAWFYLPIEITFPEDEEKIFTKKIEQHVAEFIGNRSLAPSTDSRKH
jgi:tetraacyldisaccharide 4'-kinase